MTATTINQRRRRISRRPKIKSSGPSAGRGRTRLLIPIESSAVQTLAERSRSALPMTDTELADIAALASIGLRRMPSHG